MLDVQINPPALQAIRERSGMTVVDLASAAGIDRTTLTNIEADRKKASPRTIVALARALKVALPAIIKDPEPEAVTQ
jgi:transcriptional regulator with XRE-family HTH domain